MKNTKFVYNAKTLKYESVQKSFKQVILRYIGFFFAIIFTSIVFTFLMWTVWDAPRIKINNIRIQSIIDKYEQLNQEIKYIESDMESLERRDNEVYRTIFQVPLASDSIREWGAKTKLTDRRNVNKNDLFSYVELKIYTLRNRLNFQKRSYDKIQTLVKNKELLFLATPAIQPISNKDLRRIASGFGYRIDPIYKTEKFHEGLDFSAPIGTPIYATADGFVIKEEFNAGYGNHIVLEHGYGYKTLYGHMDKFNVKMRQKVKRGEIIGFVGNTGKSVGPHCHYEVIKNNVKVDPVYYFYSDLTPTQFEQIVRMAQVKNQSID